VGIQSVTIIPRGRSGEVNNLYQATRKVTLRVLTTSSTVGANEVLAAVDPVTSLAVPPIGHAYNLGGVEIINGCRVQKLTATEEGEDAQSWLVEVDYGPYDGNTFGNDPTAWPITVSFGGTQVEETRTYDRNGNPIVNSAGDPFAEPVTIERSRSTITIERRELVHYSAGPPASGFSLTLAQTYSDTVNQFTWNGFAAGTCRMGTIMTSGPPQYDAVNDDYFYTVIYPVFLNRDGWARKLLDQGFAYLDGSNKLRQVLGSDGQASKEPVLLDGTGHQLAHGGTPAFMTYDVYDAIDWAGLNLNLSLRLGN
jgi:hypothetical protein